MDSVGNGGGALPHQPNMDEGESRLSPRQGPCSETASEKDRNQPVKGKVSLGRKERRLIMKRIVDENKYFYDQSSKANELIRFIKERSPIQLNETMNANPKVLRDEMLKKVVEAVVESNDPCMLGIVLENIKSYANHHELVLYGFNKSISLKKVFSLQLFLRNLEGNDLPILIDAMKTSIRVQNGEMVKYLFTHMNDKNILIDEESLKEVLNLAYETEFMEAIEPILAHSNAKLIIPGFWDRLADSIMDGENINFALDILRNKHARDLLLHFPGKGVAEVLIRSIRWERRIDIFNAILQSNTAKNVLMQRKNEIEEAIAVPKYREHPEKLYLIREVLGLPTPICDTCSCAIQ